MYAATMQQRRAEAKDKLQRALDIQKEKLLIAFNQAPDKIFGEEEEKLVKHVATYLPENSYARYLQSTPWDDSKAKVSIAATLKKHAPFSLSKYLICAQDLCVAFLDKHDGSDVSTSVEYVLVHSRQFGNPTKRIFDNDPETMDVSSIDSNQQALQQAVPDASIVERAQILIEKLKECHNDNNCALFQSLNIYITSFALVIVRRRTKRLYQIQRSTYCSIAMQNRWSSVYLIIEAYLNTDDDKTKKNLRETCVKHIEWFNLQLPYLFYKVLDLYNIDAGELWDNLISVKSPYQQIELSLINIATEYYSKHRLAKSNPEKSQRWFPFCQLVDNKYHRYMTYEENKHICWLLNLLVEMKDKNEMLKANEYPRSVDSEWAKRTVTELYTKIISLRI